jgi:lipid II isoglutaminyl synthase (glutamine-hydrolysing)
MLAPKLAAAKAVGGLVRRAGRGGGTSLPGKLLNRLEPHAIGLLAGRLAHGSVVISATNGKTTTAAMAAAVLERSGRRLVHNRAGANMAGGVASALAAASRRGGRELDGDLGLFEVDEFWLGPVAEELEPRALLLGNLFRDQLDRYGELETIADRWAAVVAARAGRSRLVLNADDPLVADLGRDAAPLYYGVQDDAMAHSELQHASDSKHCRRCGHAYAYDAAYMGHLGRYHCPACGNRRPEPAVAAEAVELRGIHSAAFTLRTPAGSTRVELPLPGLYNVYNALGAAALCLALDVPLADVAAGLAAVEPAFGRAETLDLGGRPTSILLIKNPAGANEVLRTLALEGGPLDLFGILNDRIADGRDVSWVWDADWETLEPHVRRMTCSGTRAAELALRMKYAGVPVDRLHVVDDVAEGLDHALRGGQGPLYALPTYTALLELRELLTARGQAREYWR